MSPDLPRDGEKGTVDWEQWIGLIAILAIDIFVLVCVVADIGTGH